MVHILLQYYPADVQFLLNIHKHFMIVWNFSLLMLGPAETSVQFENRVSQLHFTQKKIAHFQVKMG